MAGEKSLVMLNAVDILFDINNKYVLVAKRKNEPFKSFWALPGGMQEQYESLTHAVVRILKHRLGLIVDLDESSTFPAIKFPQLKRDANLHQIRTYDSGTDPRGGNTTLFAIQLHVDKEALMKIIKPQFSFDDVRLVEKTQLPQLAFDHSKFVEQYYTFLKPYPKTEAEYDASAYEKPAVTVDIIILTVKDNSLKVLLIKRKAWPFKDYWALPGGFTEMDESIDESARRELEEEAGVRDVYLEQLYTFGAPRRDPRTRVISVAYFALASADRLTIKAASDASDAAWFDLESLPRLAFDHKEMLEYAIGRIRGKIEYTNIAFQLLPSKFTMSELQSVYQVVLGKPLDKRNFAKKMKEANVLKELKEMRLEGAHRPARLYSFKAARQ